MTAEEKLVRAVAKDMVGDLEPVATREIGEKAIALLRRLDEWDIEHEWSCLTTAESDGSTQCTCGLDDLRKDTAEFLGGGGERHDRWNEQPKRRHALHAVRGLWSAVESDLLGGREHALSAVRESGRGELARPESDVSVSVLQRDREVVVERQREREGAGMTDKMSVLADIGMERASQDCKWGRQDHDDAKWALILGEEFGEACKASLENMPEQLVYDEVIQVAAVAAAWAEAIRRRDDKEPG